MPTTKLKQLFPQAVAFTPRGEKDPLHFTAYATDPQSPGAKPLGFAFWTVDINPEELGYHGHIHMLVGMNTVGMLTGVIVDWNTEPYGDFSVEPPAFGAQFRGKSIRDPVHRREGCRHRLARDDYRAGRCTHDSRKLAHGGQGRAQAGGRR